MNVDSSKSQHLRRATASDSLDTRLRINEAYGSADFGEWLFERLAVRPGEAVLDVGCGTGAQSLRFAKLVQPGGTVSALDISADSVAALKRGLEPDQAVEAEIADMSDLGQVIDEKFTIKTYDLVHSSYALYYAERPSAVLDTMHGALAPGGRLAVFTPNGKHGLVDLAVSLGPVPAEVTDCMRFGPSVLEPWFRDRFRDVEIHHFHNELRIPTVEQVMTFYRATTYFRTEVEPGFREAVEKAVAHAGCFEYEKNGFLIIGHAGD